MGSSKFGLSALLCFNVLRFAVAEAFCDVPCGSGKSLVCYDLYFYSWTACDFDKHNVLRFNVPFSCGCCEKDDADGDGICDDDDKCHGFDDRENNHSNKDFDGCEPSEQPSSFPTLAASLQPTEFPSTMPTSKPSLVPTALPSLQPSNEPSMNPTVHASMYPTCGDADFDGVCDDDDICPGGDDNTDNDGDGVPNACDNVNRIVQVAGFLCPLGSQLMSPPLDFGPNCELNKITYELWLTPPSELGFPVRSGCWNNPVGVGDLAGCSFCDDDDTQNTARTLSWFLRLGFSGCSGTVVTSTFANKLIKSTLQEDGIDLCSLDYSLGFDGPEYVTITLPKRFEAFLVSEICVANDQNPTQ